MNKKEKVIKIKMKQCLNCKELLGSDAKEHTCQEKRYGMLCGFGNKPEIIKLGDKRSGKHYCIDCGEFVIKISEATLDIQCDFYFLCYKCKEKKANNIWK